MFEKNEAQMGSARRVRHHRGNREKASWLLRQMLFGQEDEGQGRGRRRRRSGSRGRGGDGPDGSGRGGAFGGRRPLRFLARKLELDAGQFEAIAVILGDLRTERAQLAVDTRRAAAALGDALIADAFDEAKTASAQAAVAAARKRLDEHIATALRRLHELLEPKQRQALAGLIREMPPWFL